MSRIAAMLALLVAAWGVAPLGAHAAGSAPEPSGPALRAEAPPVPQLGFTLLAGVGLPACRGSSACDGSFGAAPSLQALVLYQPRQFWAVGLAGQIERLHWETTGISMIGGGPSRVTSDVMAGFAGLAGRFVPLPEWSLTPVAQLAVGLAFQERGQSYGCSHGASPAAQIAVGARARVGSSAFVFAMASARAAVTDGCLVLDAPSMPLAAWGFGFHAGAAFDVALGHAESPTRASP